MTRHVSVPVVCLLAGICQTLGAQSPTTAPVPQPPASSGPGVAAPVNCYNIRGSIERCGNAADGPTAASPFKATVPTIFVLGEVRSPGPIEVTGPMSLLDVIVAAGNLSTAAGDEVFIIRGSKEGTRQASLPGDTARTTRIDLQDLLTGKAVQPIVVQDGDTVMVPRAQALYMRGEIRNPGAYSFRKDMTVGQAIALAGDLTPIGSERKITILRSVKGRAVEIKAKLTDILQADDTVNVGRRNF